MNNPLNYTDPSGYVTEATEKAYINSYWYQRDSGPSAHGGGIGVGTREAGPTYQDYVLMQALDDLISAYNLSYAINTAERVYFTESRIIFINILDPGKLVLDQAMVGNDALGIYYHYSKSTESLTVPYTSISIKLGQTYGNESMISSTGGDDAYSGRGSVGQPGTWESIIPIWGSGRAAVDHFQNGNYGRAALNTALAISDIFLVKSIGTAIGKGAWKLGSNSWRATRAWLGKKGYAEAGQPVHHWAVSQATAKKYGLDAVTNQPWNLKTFANQSIHMRAGHGMNYLGQPGYGTLGQLWYGTPVWPKVVVVSYGGRIITD